MFYHPNTLSRKGLNSKEYKSKHNMGRHTSILYQIVYSTKHRIPCMGKSVRSKIFKHIYGTLQNNNCHTYRINGIEDHLHILIDLHPSVALSSLIKGIKLGSSAFIKKEKLIADFPGWQVGYGAFTYSPDAKHNLIEYIKNQEYHHRNITFKKEYIGLLKENRVDYDERYVFDRLIFSCCILFVPCISCRAIHVQLLRSCLMHATNYGVVEHE